MTSDAIIQDFDGVAAAAELFLERYYRAKQKLESFHSPASPKRAKGLDEVEAARLIANRKKNISKSRKP